MIEIIAAAAAVAIIIAICEYRVGQLRRELVTERDAWAQAAAKERETLLRYATDERAALLSSVTANSLQPYSPWPTEEGPKLYRTEEDEIEGLVPAENIESELASRGLVDLN